MRAWLKSIVREAQQGIGQRVEVPGDPEALLQKECYSMLARGRGPSAQEGHPYQR
jgi:hypothetical protein